MKTSVYKEKDAFGRNRCFSSIHDCDTIEKNEVRCKAMHLAEMNLQELIRPEGHDCACGRHHGIGLKFLRIGSGAAETLPEGFKALGCKKPFIVCDGDTKKAAWHFVQPVLEKAGIGYVLYTIHRTHPEPDEETVGEITMAFDPACDCILAVGSGVINDCCKVLARAVGKPQLVVGTAPSMDGYTSTGAAMIMGGMKVTYPVAVPTSILADTAVLKDAPMELIRAGYGDIVGKFSALNDWKLSHAVKGEYFCQKVYDLMAEALQKKGYSLNAQVMQREKEPDIVNDFMNGGGTVSMKRFRFDIRA